MKKNKIILLSITFVLCCVYCVFSNYLLNSNEDSKVYDYLYNELYSDYQDLLATKNMVDSEYRVVGAKIIERNIYTFFDQIIINRGSDDGVKKGDAVVNNNGLVGVISKVHDSYSEVTLISDNNLKVSVKINDSYGIYNNGHVDNIVNYEEINIGDEVYTSSLTDLVGGLYIGKVKSVNLDDYEIKKIIDVDLLDLSDLKYVYVVGK